MAHTGSKTDIWVYAHWQGMPDPKCIGILSAHQGKGRKAFSFEYDAQWLHSGEQLLLDPDIGWYGGAQFPDGKDNFGIFLDSMPDRWGRTLLQRKAAQAARRAGRPAPVLHDIDFLLGVFDESRMGALRFKLAPDGPFLDNDPSRPVPPWSSAASLQFAASRIESPEEGDDAEQWLLALVAPGSSLGGARPKANVLDHKGHPWIAKFPSHHDAIDKGAWEYLAFLLATEAGIDMAPCKLENTGGVYHTFFSKRFDRNKGERIHFASAMTMTGHNEDSLRNYTPSYLELAEFIQFSCPDVRDNLHRLWRRIVFNIAISNTDDHLRNHGFLLSEKGWALSPAYDINPSIDKNGLALNIDANDNALDIGLARSVGPWFQLTEKEMDAIIFQIKNAVANWRQLANKIGIPRSEQELMGGAFRL
jgi:serine/threonine-protein kinase HipA